VPDPNIAALEIGQCVHGAPRESLGTSVRVVQGDHLEVVGCLTATDPSTGATGEVFDVVTLDQPDAPTDQTVPDPAARCSPTALDEARADYRIRLYVSTRETWESGVHEVACVAENHEGHFPIPGVAPGSITNP